MNALLERKQKTAAFNESDNTKLQQYADLCPCVESQMSYLPGLACLNFPNTIQPLAEKLPSSLRGKWEKEIAKYADNNAGAYPSFRNFAKVIQDQAKIKNNPNILAGKKFVNPASTTTASTTAGRTTKRSRKTPALQSTNRKHSRKRIAKQNDANFTSAKDTT